jgi:HTH-type transcriptional regulator/antitoxin HigA
VKLESIFFTPRLPKVPINRSTRWIKDTPVIQLTAWYKQNDRFWFTFFHEAGHILLNGKKYISLENIDFSGADPSKEQDAHHSKPINLKNNQNLTDE